MKLREWLDKGNTSYGGFAKKLGISAPAVSGYLTGKTMPSLPIAIKIVGLTKGEVQYEDLLINQEVTDLDTL